MATIYQKTATDRCIILQPREAMLRKMNIPVGWSDLAIAMAFSITSDVGDNATPVTEALNVSSALDRISFGIKDDSTILPLMAGSRFIGLNTFTPWDSTVRINDSGGWRTDGKNSSWSGTSWVLTDGVTQRYLTSDQGSSHRLSCGSNPTADSSYSNWISIRMIRTADDITVKYINTPCTTDPNSTAIQTFFDTASWQYVANNYALSGIGAWDVRNIFLRLPFRHNRARVHCYGYKLFS